MEFIRAACFLHETRSYTSTQKFAQSGQYFVSDFDIKSSALIMITIISTSKIVLSSWMLLEFSLLVNESHYPIVFNTFRSQYFRFSSLLAIIIHSVETNKQEVNLSFFHFIEVTC